MATLTGWASFSKKKNSTKQPTGSGTDFTVTLKDGCSLDAPVFILNGAGLNNFGLNYVQFQNAYYYVDDIVSQHNNLVEIHCSKDVLATYKSSIQASTQHVLYYNHSNSQIVDPRLSVKTAITVDSDTETFNNLGTGQSYMITAVGSEKTTIFALDKSDADNLFTDVYLQNAQQAWDGAITLLQSDIDALTPSTVIEALKVVPKQLLNMFKIWCSVNNMTRFSDDTQRFLKNCYVLPMDKSNIGGSDSAIKLGSWTAYSRGNKDFPRIVHDSATVDIPWQASDWRRNSPYHEIYLYIPYIGLVNISPSEVIGVTTITVNVSIDTYSGVTSFVVNASNGTVLGQYSTNIAAPYAIGSSNIDMVSSGAQIVSSVAGIAGGILSGNPMVGSGALGITNALKPFDSSISSNGGAAGMGLGNTVKCFTVFHDTSVAPSDLRSVKGEPYNGKLSLSGITGYVQTSGASVDIQGFGNDKDRVNNFLNGGIYIE